MGNHTPEVDRHEGGCVFIKKKEVRRWTSILKEECKVSLLGSRNRLRVPVIDLRFSFQL